MNDCSWYGEQISAYLDGMLTREEERALQAHLADCPECSALLDELRELSEAVASLQREPPPDFAEKAVARAAAARRIKSMIRSITAMAAMFCVVLLGVGSIFLFRESPADGRPVASNAPSASAYAAPAEPVSSPSSQAKCRTFAKDKSASREKNAAAKESNPSGEQNAESSSGSVSETDEPQETAFREAEAAPGPGNGISTAGAKRPTVNRPLETETAISSSPCAGSSQASQWKGGPYFAVLTARSAAAPPESSPNATYLILNEEEFNAFLASWEAKGVQYTLDTTGENIDSNAQTGLVLFHASN